MIRCLFLYAPVMFLLYQGAAAWQDLYNQGMEQVKAGNGRRAIEFLSQAAEANPKPSVSPRYTPYFYLGLCYDSIGDEKNALLYYEKSNALKEVSSFPEDQEILQTHIREIRENGRTFQVIVKDGSRPAASREKPSPEASESAPRKNQIAESRPPSAGPAPTKPAPSRPVTESGRDRNGEILRQAVVDYLSGNYSSALNAARRYLDEGGRQVDKASFVAGASLFSQFLLTGQQDPSLERAADRYLRDAVPYSPPQNWISPLVLEHYRKVSGE